MNSPYPCPVTATCLLVLHKNHWFITDLMQDYHLYTNIKPPKTREKIIKILFIREIIALSPFSLPKSGIDFNIGLYCVSLSTGHRKR